jgi:hypothetical protein
MSDDMLVFDPQEADKQTWEVKRYWEGIHDEAEFEIHHMGFPRLQRPTYTCPALDPKALSQMSLVQYAETHLRYVGWMNFAENNLAYVKSMLIGVKRQMEEVLNLMKIKAATTKNPNTGKPFSIDDRKVIAESSPRYIELLRERTKLESMKELVESQFSGLKETAATISRHIELKKLEIESMRTNHNMPGRGMYNQP